MSKPARSHVKNPLAGHMSNSRDDRAEGCSDARRDDRAEGCSDARRDDRAERNPGALAEGCSDARLDNRRDRI